MTKICLSEKKTPPLIIKSVVEKIKLQSKTLLICCQIKLSKICDESRSKHMAYEGHEFGKYSTPNVHNCIFLTFSHICFASAEHTKETVSCVHAVLISHYLSSLNLLMMKLDFFGLEHLAVKGQKKSTYLPPPPTFQPQQSQSKNPFICKKVEQGQFKKWTNYIAVFCTLEFTLTTAYNHIGLTLNFA